jgi:hypothetical protein
MHSVQLRKNLAAVRFGRRVGEALAVARKPR